MEIVELLNKLGFKDAGGVIYKFTFFDQEGDLDLEIEYNKHDGSFEIDDQRFTEFVLGRITDVVELKMLLVLLSRERYLSKSLRAKWDRFLLY